MSKIEAHINNLFRDIPDSRLKTEIVQEITRDLSEKADDLIEQGKTEEEAVRITIEDFGDDVGEIKKELVGSEQLRKTKNLGLSFAFSVWGVIIISALFVFINLYYTPHIIWFPFPVFAVAWWPLCLYFYWSRQKSGRSAAFPQSVAGFILILALLLFTNYYYSPHNVWFVYPAFAAVWWPIAMFFKWLRQKNKEDDCLE
jgi:hypothetical protein